MQIRVEGNIFFMYTLIFMGEKYIYIYACLCICTRMCKCMCKYVNVCVCAYARVNVGFLCTCIQRFIYSKSRQAGDVKIAIENGHRNS